MSQMNRLSATLLGGFRAVEIQASRELTRIPHDQAVAIVWGSAAGSQ